MVRLSCPEMAGFECVRVHKVGRHDSSQILHTPFLTDHITYSVSHNFLQLRLFVVYRATWKIEGVNAKTQLE